MTLLYYDTIRESCGNLRKSHITRRQSYWCVGWGLKLLVYEALSYWCIRLDCFRLDRIGQQPRLLVYEVYNY